MAADVAPMAQRGLAPTLEVWTAPQAWRAVVTPIVLTLVGFVIAGVAGAAVGALFGLGYILLARPKGTLTVTFSPSRVPIPAWSSISPASATMSFAEPMRSSRWGRQSG